MRYCHCHDDGYEGRQMLANAMYYAMTDFYLAFHKTRTIRFLLLEFDHEDIEYVRIPKHHEDDYMEKIMQMQKDCIALIDQGYTNNKMTPENIETFREMIAKYQQGKNEVWE